MASAAGSGSGSPVSSCRSGWQAIATARSWLAYPSLSSTPPSPASSRFPGPRLRTAMSPMRAGEQAVQPAAKRLRDVLDHGDAG